MLRNTNAGSDFRGCPVQQVKLPVGKVEVTNIPTASGKVQPNFMGFFNMYSLNFGQVELSLTCPIIQSSQNIYIIPCNTRNSSTSVKHTELRIGLKLSKIKHKICT